MTTIFLTALLLLMFVMGLFQILDEVTYTRLFRGWAQTIASVLCLLTVWLA